MYKIQVMMMDGEWHDCHPLATFANGNWRTPEFASEEAAQVAIDAEPEVAEWQRVGTVRIVAAVTPSHESTRMPVVTTKTYSFAIPQGGHKFHKLKDGLVIAQCGFKPSGKRGGWAYFTQELPADSRTCLKCLLKEGTT